jgi:hypothetical protein
MTITAARVEVLTAEVRVLMVGSRQVTLSVFRQLDYVPPGCIEPFGRVQDRSESGWVVVVGGSRRAVDRSALVRCSVSAEVERRQALRWRQAGGGGEPVYGDGGPGPPEECERLASVCEAHARLAGEWAELPLIVLAGLR